MSKTLIFSTVSSEFGMLRQRLANLTQRTKKCQVRHENDFFHRGVKTLQKLVEEVQERMMRPAWTQFAANNFAQDGKTC